MSKFFLYGMIICICGSILLAWTGMMIDHYSYLEPKKEFVADGFIYLRDGRVILVEQSVIKIDNKVLIFNDNIISGNYNLYEVNRLDLTVRAKGE
jgi:hypothetical protein